MRSRDWEPWIRSHWIESKFGLFCGDLESCRARDFGFWVNSGTNIWLYTDKSKFVECPFQDKFRH